MKTLKGAVTGCLDIIGHGLAVKNPNDAILIYIDSQFVGIAHCIHGWFAAACGPQGPTKELYFSTTPFNTMLEYLGLKVPEQVHANFAFTIDYFMDPNHSSLIYYKLPLNHGVLHMKFQCLTYALNWLFSADTMNRIECTAGSLATQGLNSEREDTIAKHRPTLLMRRSAKNEAMGDIRVKTIVRSKVLYDMALECDADWVSKVKEETTVFQRCEKEFWNYGRSHAVRAGNIYFHFDKFGVFCTGGHPGKKQPYLKINFTESFTPEFFCSSREAFCGTICDLALLDMREGATISEYYEKCLQVAYLTTHHCLRLSPTWAEPIKWHSERLFIMPSVSKTMNLAAQRPQELILEDVIAIIERPNFESYKDGTPHKPGSFDYITVEVSLVHKYGRKSLEIARNHNKRLKELIMEKVTKALSARHKEGLAQYLYVKELTACGGGYTISALVEFKPGLEEILTK